MSLGWCVIREEEYTMDFHILPKSLVEPGLLNLCVGNICDAMIGGMHALEMEVAVVSKP